MSGRDLRLAGEDLAPGGTPVDGADGEISAGGSFNKETLNNWSQVMLWFLIVEKSLKVPLMEF
jgi:hypothetical protein